MIIYTNEAALNRLKSSFFSGVLVLFPSQSNLERDKPESGEHQLSFHFVK